MKRWNPFIFIVYNFKETKVPENDFIIKLPFNYNIVDNIFFTKQPVFFAKRV